MLPKIVKHNHTRACKVCTKHSCEKCGQWWWCWNAKCKELDRLCPYTACQYCRRLKLEGSGAPSNMFQVSCLNCGSIFVGEWDEAPAYWLQILYGKPTAIDPYCLPCWKGDPEVLPAEYKTSRPQICFCNRHRGAYALVKDEEGETEGVALTGEVAQAFAPEAVMVQEVREAAPAEARPDRWPPAGRVQADLNRILREQMAAAARRAVARRR